MIQELAERHTDNTRLEAFSDAIFGFAATLLVVSLDVPSSYDALVHSLYGFVAFGLSFAMLVALWWMHRDFFRRFPLGDAKTVLLNTALLFLILFYVYPLKFLARLIAGMVFRDHSGGENVAIQPAQLGGMFTIYGFGWAAVFCCLALMYLHAAREGSRMSWAPARTRDARDRFGQFLVMAGVGIVSAGFAMANVGVRFGVPGWMYALTGPALSLYWAWRHRTPDTSATTIDRA